MSPESGPRLATEDDFPDVVELLDRVFSYGTGGMAAHIPNWFDESHPERYAIIKQDNRVVSAVGCLPQTFVIGEGEIECWGIGNVATDKHYRGNGYMSRLLKFWVEQLHEAGVPIAELGGDRKRYNRYGWEKTGREYIYSLTERTFPEISGDDADIRRYSGREADITLLEGIHRTEDYRVKRSQGEYYDLFGQHGLETLLYTGDSGKSYLSFNQEVPSGRYSTQTYPQVVPEFGGTADGVHILLSYLWRHYDVSRLGVSAHPSHHLNTYLRSLSTTWSLEPHRMMNLLDLAGTLRGFAAQMTDRWGSAPHAGNGAVTIDIADSNDPPVTISYSSSNVNVEETPGKEPDISLNRLETTQFLFGFSSMYSSLKSQYPFLSITLPLDFYIWPIDGP